MPVVQVKMSKECHKALKQYAGFFEISMGEAMYRCARYTFHKQAHVCTWMDNTLKVLGITLDKGSEKPCFGFYCNVCKNRTGCRTGVYEGTCQLMKEAELLMKPEGLRQIEEFKKWKPVPCAEAVSSN